LSGAAYATQKLTYGGPKGGTEFNGAYLPQQGG